MIKSEYNSQDWKAACKGYNAFEIRIPESRPVEQPEKRMNRALWRG